MTNLPQALLGVAVGFVWMLFIKTKSDTAVSVWSPGIDVPSFAFAALLMLWGGSKLAVFIGGAIFGVHAAQLKFHADEK